MLRSFINRDVLARTWTRLRRVTGETLHLEPGERVKLDLPDDFDDPYLKEAPALVRKASASAVVKKAADTSAQES